MKKQVIAMVLATGITITTGGWIASSYMNENLEETIVKLEDKIVQKNDNIRQKSTKIANLEDVIVNKDKQIDSAKKAIDTQNQQIQTKDKQIQTKDQAILQKDSEIRKLQQEIANFKKKQEGSDVEGRKITVTATAYTAFCSEGCTGVTATGVNVSNTIYYKGYRVIAVDTNLIPLNSLVRVEAQSESFTAIAIDTGGAIRGHIIDVLVSSESGARQFGRQQATLTILREGER